MMVSTAEASDGVKLSSNKGYYTYNNTKSIKFIERGVKFYIFPNGKINFNTQSLYRTQYYYRNGRRYKKRIQHRSISIDRDYSGRVRRVGSIFIDYRYRRMTRAGGLRISYDHYGNVRYFGHVKPNYRNRFNDYYFDDYIYDDNYYYYKSKRGKKTLEKDIKKERS